MEDNYIGKFLDNRYEILEKIGSGGMATVYKARCHRLNRFVAIKILKADLAENEDLRRRFHAESQAVAMLSHPNIVAVYDVNHTDNLDYIVMELIDGITLKQYINRKGILNWKEALHFTTQITKALSHAHSRGIIHRDIKPHNIMILRDGSVKVADFGIARLLSTKNTLTQEALGSVHYISPEQAKGGQVDARSDIYSLGVVMYEMLTSRLPFEGDSPVSVAIQHISSIPLQPKEINPNIPTGLAQITMHAMEPNMDLRYPSADALLADLEEFRKNPSVEFSYSSVPETDDGMDKTIVSGGSLITRKIPGQLEKKKSGNAVSRDRTTKAEYRKNRKKANRTALFVGIFLTVAFVAAVAVLLITGPLSDIFSPKVERISIPDFKDQDAEEIIKNPDYSLFRFTIKETDSDTVAAGKVISQDPSAERTVSPQNGTIDIMLTVSTGPRVVLMPEVLNMDYRDAQNLLEQLEYDLVLEIERVPEETVTKGRVLEQVPEADSKLTRGMTVWIQVSDGPEYVPVSVPSLKGLYKKVAIGQLEAAELSYREEYLYSDDVEEDYVIDQDIPPETEVAIHELVTIYISLGPDPEKEPVVDDTPLPQPVQPTP
ncbi:MAG: Stk1 family PASTA domain-containing Ser/Thr kinase, partial [Oscillospiraceae bacterium]|nr:Stk1 family PASTA domain-containing Ser/Thr kinase [Oscillospiraceae bacterium]